MNKTNKSKKTLIVILLCTLVTLGVTIGISCYNYYGYVNYKINYLSDFFDVNNKLGVTVEDKIERSLLWDSSYYTDDLEVTYRDPKTKETYTSELVSDEHAMHLNANVKENVLHLPNYFDVHLYQMVTETTNEKGTKDYTLTYYFYFYNINYNTIPDFDPNYIRMTFVNGIGEESDTELEEALKDFNINGETGNQPETYSYSILSENGEDTLANFSIYDNPINVEEKDETQLKYYYVYRNRCTSSVDDQTTFNKAKQLTFSIYYLNDTDESHPDLINIVEGTYTAKLNEKGEVYTPEEVFNLGGTNVGYNKNFYQDSYNEYVKPKIVKAAIITFVVSAIVCALFAIVWVYEPQIDNLTNKKNKKTK